MSSKILIDEWLMDDGLTVIKFPVDAEYFTLNQVLKSIKGQGCVLIHSKSLRDQSLCTSNTIKIDATGHALTARTVLRQRISASDDITTLDNLEDIQSISSQLYKIKKSHSDIHWWIWWSPSDLIAHDIDEIEILRCLRAITKEFADIRFLALVAKEVHSKQALARLEYIADVTLDIERIRDKGHNTHHWHIQKHPIMEREGVEFVA